MNRSDEHGAGAGGDGADGGSARDAEHGGGKDGAEGGVKSRINLSAPQVVAGGVATLTAATAASYLGVYGTIAGAAVMSVLSTAGTAVTQHFLEQSQEKAKEKAKEVAGRAKTVAAPRGHPQNGDRAGGPSAGQQGAAAAGPAGSGQPADPDATAAFRRESAGGDPFAQTEAWDPRNGATRAMPAVGADPGDTAVGGADDATRRLDADGGGAAGDGPRGTAGGADDGAGGGEQESFWRRYRMPLIVGAVLFVGVMLVILAFELLTGRSLSDTVHGREGSSSPSILGGVEQTDQPGGQDTGPTSEPGTGPTGDGGQDGDSTDQPDGGQETGDPDGGQDTGEPGGGRETGDPGGGQDTGEPGGDQDTGEPGSGEDGQDNQPGNGQDQQPESGQGDGGAAVQPPAGSAE